MYHKILARLRGRAASRPEAHVLDPNALKFVDIIAIRGRVERAAHSQGRR